MSLLKKLFGKKEEQASDEIQEAPATGSVVEPAPQIIKKPIEVSSSKQVFVLTETDTEWDGSDSELAMAVKEALPKYVESYLFNEVELGWAHRYITQGKLNNEKTKAVAEKLSSKIGRDYGMCNDMVRTVDTLLDTDTQVKSLTQAGLNQYQVVCHLDKKTCPRCAQHDLKIYNVVDGPKPPFHKNCRCHIIPVNPDVLSSTRPAKNGEGKSIKVPATMSYSEWKETYWPKPQPSNEKSISTDQLKPQHRPPSDGIDWGRPNLKQAKAVKTAIPKYEDVHLYNEKELKEAQEIIIQGIMDGSQFDYVAKKLSEAIERDFDECHDLVRTVMAQASVDSEVKSLTESGLTQYRIYAVLDKRTCTCCGQYDQKIYDLAEGPKPPFHKNCRCTIGTVLSDDLRMRRAARDENDKTIQVPGIMTWSEWRTIYAFTPAVPEPDHKKL